MATCDVCGTWILFGPTRVAGRTYCGQNCVQNDFWQVAVQLVTDDEAEKETRSVHQGNCPVCHGPGPVDVHSSHKVYSALAFTRWSSHAVISCRSCARKRQAKHAAFSTLLGWWGFPFGLLITPVQVVRNLNGILGITGPNPETPSPDLARAVRMTVAAGKRTGVGPA